MCLYRSLSHALAKTVCLISLASLACGCAGRPSSPDAALNSFSGDRILAHIRTLSSDEFEGRGPGSKGEDLTIQYLQDQFRGAGLESGNPDGTYLQSVRLVGITADSQMKLSLKGHGHSLAPKFQSDFVAWTKRMADKSAVDAGVIFAGYGVQAPEFQWDDFKGMDVRGKVLVVLINDPAVPDPQNPGQLDPKTFGGKAMTYYGRWTYKFEKAAELGAAGCLIVHQTDRAGYPWEVVRNSWSAEQFDLESPDKNMNRLALEGWISQETADNLFRTVTAEVQGLLGSRYYAEHPLYPRARTAMDINMDTMNVHGRTRDIVMIGMGNSTLDETVADVARQQGRTVKPDPEPEKGSFYRSDHFSFSKEGVPAFDPDSGIDFIGKPEGWGLQVRQKYTAENYHKPSDKIQPDWDMSGAVQDAQLYFLVGYRVANSDLMPEWKPGTEFKAKRDAMLQSAQTGN